MKKILSFLFLAFSAVYLFSFFSAKAIFTGGTLSGEISLFHQSLSSCGVSFDVPVFPFQICFFSFLAASSLAGALSLFTKDLLNSSVILSGILGGEAITYSKWLEYLSSIQRGGVLRTSNGLILFRASQLHLHCLLPQSVWLVVVPFAVLVIFGIISEVRKK